MCLRVSFIGDVFQTYFHCLPSISLKCNLIIADFFQLVTLPLLYSSRNGTIISPVSKNKKPLFLSKSLLFCFHINILKCFTAICSSHSDFYFPALDHHIFSTELFHFYLTDSLPIRHTLSQSSSDVQCVERANSNVSLA